MEKIFNISMITLSLGLAIFYYMIDQPVLSDIWNVCFILLSAIIINKGK